MSGLTIKTNNHMRDLVCYEDLPERIKPDFDYLNQEETLTPRFVKYRGLYIDCYDMMRTDGSALSNWDGYCGDSYFSGTLVKFIYDDYGYEAVIVGTYYS